ncbi:MAG: alpha-2-macroglobulin [Saprospirales bacterium]|nr:alpha-2-macroglobulin [Saprospirales bacterium]
MFTHVSNLGYWEHREEGGKLAFVVFDRQTGVPQEGVTGEFWRRNYNSIFRKYEWKKAGSSKSDARGFLRPDVEEKNDYYNLLLRNGNDTLYLEDGFSTYYYSRTKNTYQQTSFFLDRSIYRPGQTIYFKALVLEKNESGMPRIVANAPVTIKMRDANYQEVGKLELRTNAYGTVTGTFKAPEGGLLGSMHLESSSGNTRQYFRVEEYKRPKFEVTFKDITEAYRLDEEVKITGHALGFAGNNIDGADVKYRVVREVSYPWWGGWYRSSRPSGQSMEIINGTLETDANGQFVITFQAKPDRSVDPKTQPQFTFRVYADVTDITGETHSSESYVSLGYLALKAAITLPDEMSVEDLQTIPIQTQNLQGQFEPAKGTLRLDLLQTPDQLFANRYWNASDMHMIPEAEFRKDFPQYAYDQEDKIQNWKVKRMVLENPFNTAENTSMSLGRVRLEPGVYLLTLQTADKYGQKVEVKKWVTLYDPSGKKMATNDWGWVHLEKNTLEPGEKATWLIQSAVKQIKVLFEVEREGKLLRSEWVDVKRAAKLTQEIQEADRGNIQVQIHFAGLNRSFDLTQTIVVPWTNKQLKVELATFRDKLLPGSEEEWRVKIKGPKGEKVTAEMVAAMYDASLDQFAAHDWAFQPYPSRSSGTMSIRPKGYEAKSANYLFYPNQPWEEVLSRTYRSLNWFNYPFYRYEIMASRALDDSVEFTNQSIEAAPKMAMKMDADGVPDMEDSIAPSPPPPPSPYSVEEGNQAEKPEAYNKSEPLPVKVRTDLDETVFFMPDLMTDEEGNIILRFKMKEALTRWKLLGFAHTLNLESGILRQEVITQKELMVLPNPPRFYRERDEIEFTAKVVNLTDKTLRGNGELQLLNPLNTTPVYKWLDNPQFNQHFTVEPGQSARLAWRFKVPDVNEVSVIEHTVVAAAGDFQDAERAAAPVLSNRMLVTETLPLPVKGEQTRTFVMQSLATNTSTTLANQRFTLEFTSNPAWYAVQALPYLMEYPYECTEQIFSRFYANSLATSVANSHPKVKEVFDKWRDTPAMESNLTKNEELKSALLQETPWVLQALSEEEQKRNIGLLFDLNRMGKEQAAALDKIRERQLPGGGFSWFPGERDNWYITQYIVEGMAHLHNLGVASIVEDPQTWNMVKPAVGYIDQRMVEWYRDLEKSIGKDKEEWEKDHLSPIVIHYLYTRSFFLAANSPTRIPLDGKIEEVYQYCIQQAEKYWLNKGIYQEGMLALALHRSGNETPAQSIMRSLKERALLHEELGMYWKFNRGYFWYEHPIETQSLLIEAFDEVAKDPASVEAMKIWLLKNKQTNNWKTTKATASAVYALLRSGDNWLLSDEPVRITLGVNPSKKTAIWNKVIGQAQQKAEAGTGYFKVGFDGENVDAEMGTVTVQNPNKVIAWGGIYWQYFEDLDKIKGFEETPLTLKRQYFVAELTDTGEKIRPLAAGEALHPGDKVVVRIELRVDRPMEYIHLKDMRPSGFEPIQVLSQYKWQGGLGYYESPRDASTNFFISYLPQGTHVFEYPLRVVHKGDFSTGITTLQCMYAPEFSSHSEGIRVKVE